MTETLKIDGYEIVLNLAKSETKKIIYLPLSEVDILDEIRGLLAKVCENEDINLIAITGIEWNEDLSPWPARKVFKRDKHFTGKADEFIEVLENRIIPEVEERIYGSETDLNIERYLVGFSMAGLFTIYAGTKSDKFIGIGSISGSMWFDGFYDYMEETVKEKKPGFKKAYFSVGDKESEAKNPRFQTAEACTTEIEDLFRDHVIKTKLEINEGDHFTDMGIRIADGIAWLLSN